MTTALNLPTPFVDTPLYVVLTQFESRWYYVDYDKLVFEGDCRSLTSATTFNDLDDAVRLAKAYYRHVNGELLVEVYSIKYELQHESSLNPIPRIWEFPEE